MKFLKLKQVMEKTALSRASIYRMIANGDFPKQIQIAERNVAWLESDVEHWMRSVITNSN